ncbi:MAG: hypothetical protein NTX88_06250 [Candidatus Atribacteria bacterium]|nr:hypothetical protein [Candidatus Atribacteria bacterium]
MKTGGIVNEKYPGGIERQKKLLEEEGFQVIQKGKKHMVENYQEHLIGTEQLVQMVKAM